MLATKGANYFPFCCLMDAEGNVLKELTPSSAEAVKEAIGYVKLVAEMRKAAETDPMAKKRVGVLEMFESKSPPSFKEAKALVAASGLETVHPKLVKEGMAKVKSAIIDKINQDASKRMRAAMNGENAEKAIEAIEKERCAAFLAAYKQGMTFGEKEQTAIPFYMSVAQAAVNVKDTAVAKKAFAIFDKAVKPLYAQYEDVIAKSEGRRKEYYAKRFDGLKSMRDDLAKKVGGLAMGGAQ